MKGECALLGSTEIINKENFQDSDQKHQFHLDHFDGPLDLLLYLIQQSEINVYDIPIGTITEQYIAYLQSTKLPLEEMSSFYYMAATLIHIKSQMLLPIEIDYDDDMEDPRADLVDQLITYQRYRQYARILEEHRQQSEGRVTRRISEYPFLFPSNKDPWESLTLQKLLQVYITSIKKFAPPQIVDILEEVSVPEKMTLIKEQLSLKGNCLFSSLIVRKDSPMEVVNTVMALLEMAKHKEICIVQENPFSDIQISPGANIEERSDEQGE